MKRVNDFLEEMKDIIEKRLRNKDSRQYDICLKSYTTINNNIEAYFDVCFFGGEFWLYQVTYLYLYNTFIVSAYKFEDNYSVDG